MTLRLTLISPEVEDFILELKIDANATFADLHRLILRHCGYEEVGGQRFFICDERWKPIHRILLSDDGHGGADEDIFLMSRTELSEFLEDEGQRFAYRFDPKEHRMFLIEVSETTFGDRVANEGTLTRRAGSAPSQFLLEENITENATLNASANSTQREADNAEQELDDTFYGEDGFEEEDLDPEGFDILD